MLEQEIVGVLNFLKHPTKKVLLIVGDNETVINEELAHKLKQDGKISTTIDLRNNNDIERYATDKKASQSQVMIIIGYTKLENIFLRYSFRDWLNKIIIICNSHLLNLTLDPSLYFAPIKNNKWQKHLLAKVILAKALPAPGAQVATTETSPPASSATVTGELASFCADFLNQKLMTKDRAMMQMLADRVKRDKKFKERLFQLIYASRKNPTLAIAASNAITALNYAKVSFARLDFSYIQVPYADLQYANFDRTNLSHANLRGATLRCVYIKEAILDGCDMEDVDFDELPVFLLDQALSKVTYRPDGKMIAGLNGSKIQLFTAEPIVKTHGLPITRTSHRCIAFHPFLPLLASGDSGGFIQLWDVESGTKLCEIKSRSDHCEVNAIVFSRDGNYMAWCDNRGAVYIWEIANNYQYSINISDEKELHSLYFINEEYLIVPLPGNMAVVNLLRRENDQSQFCNTMRHLYPHGVSSTNQWLAATDDKHDIQIINLSSQSLVHNLSGHQARVNKVRWSQDDRFIFSSSQDSTLRVWDNETGACIHVILAHQSPNDFSCRPDNKVVAYCTWNRELNFSLVRSGKYYLPELNDHVLGIMSVAIGCNNKMIATGERNATVKLWSIKSGACQRVYSIQPYVSQAHHVDVGNVCLDANGKFLAATADIDRVILLWPLNSHDSTPFVLKGHTREIRSLCFSHNSHYLASAGVDKIIHLWDTKTGKLLCTFTGHEAEIHCLCFSPNDEIIASAAGDSFSPQQRGHVINLWDIQAGQLVHSLVGHSKPIWLIAYSPDGQLLASLSFDNTMRVWNLQRATVAICTKQRITSDSMPHFRITQLQGNVSRFESTRAVREEGLTLAFSPDGKRIIFGGGSAPILVASVDALNQTEEIIVHRINRTHAYWHKNSKDFSLVTADTGKPSIKHWRCKQTQNKWDSRLRWMTNSILRSHSCGVEGMQNLSPENWELLKQRTVIGKPAAIKSTTVNVDVVQSSEDTALKIQQFKEFISSKVNFFAQTRVVQHSNSTNTIAREMGPAF